MELLIKAIDATHSDPAKDGGCWKRGDVVVAMPDGHSWGRLEKLPAAEGGVFVIVKVPGQSLAQIHSETGKKFPDKLTDETRDGSGNMTRRRAARIDLDSLSADQKSAAHSVGLVTLTKQQVGQAAKKK